MTDRDKDNLARQIEDFLMWVRLGPWVNVVAGGSLGLDLYLPDLGRALVWIPVTEWMDEDEIWVSPRLDDRHRDDEPEFSQVTYRVTALELRRV